MALDHYVSQVHLRKFYAPSLGKKKMYATRKHDLKTFPCGSEDVCRIEAGSTTPYLKHPRAIEEFLKLVEPRYSTACEAFEAGVPIREDVLAIAGFAAFILACSPTMLRISEASFSELVRLEAAILDRADLLPKSPPELGGKTLSELFAEDAVAVTIDRKYPQALGISAFTDVTTTFGNFAWEALRNPFEDSPFFTSDFPVALEHSRDPAIVIRIIPLTPRLAIRIIPRLDLKEEELKPSFPHFRFRRRELSRRQVVSVNRAIVRSAENLVFHVIEAPWIRTFIDRNSEFWVHPEITVLPTETGFFKLTRTVLREKAGHRRVGPAEADDHNCV